MPVNSQPMTPTATRIARPVVPKPRAPPGPRAPPPEPLPPPSRRRENRSCIRRRVSSRSGRSGADFLGPPPPGLPHGLSPLPPPPGLSPPPPGPPPQGPPPPEPPPAPPPPLLSFQGISPSSCAKYLEICVLQ